MTDRGGATDGGHRAPLAIRVADWLLIGTLWGATLRTMAALFLMPIAADLARNDATASAAVHYGQLALYWLILLDLFGWAVRTGQLRIHTGFTAGYAKHRPAAPSAQRWAGPETATPGDSEPAEMAAARATLKVGRDATQTEIRQAWLREAKRNHPDANGTDPSAEARFIAARQAYALLSDGA